MELDFNKIIRLKKIRIEKSELSEEENALTAPILKDKSLIHEIYKIFIELLNERGCPPNIDSVTQRKKFIFIIRYLFSPSSLAGGKMTGGLRKEDVYKRQMHRFVATTLDCFTILRQSLILTVLKRMRMSIKYVKHIFYPKFSL